MELVEQPHISVLEPIGKAIEKTKEILFRPFDLKKWCVVGFCAWLATLGEGGGGGNGGGGNYGPPQQGGGPEAAEVKAWLASNLYWLAPVVLAVVLFILVISIVFCWLRSRGKFMFLHCVALNRAEVGFPWNTYSQQGNSLFLFKLAIGFITLFFVLPFLALIAFSIWLIAEADVVAGGVLMLVAGGFLFLLLCIGFGVISKFTDDFVVPIMALRYCRVMEAWREFYELLRSYKWKFVLYLLFQIVIGIVIGMIGMLATLLTGCFCCTLCIPLVGTYIATVVLLPLPVFGRSYSLYYLAQYGAAYNVFAPAAEVAAAPEADIFTGGNGI